MLNISDIQEKKIGIDECVEITFCNDETADDVMKLTLPRDVIWQIHDFAQSNLSYGAQLKKQKR